MSPHLDRLEAARRALLAADPALCAAEITAFEAICADDPPQAEVLAGCQARLKSLAALATACAEGVAAACQGLQDALAAAGRLTTYDSAGARASRDTAAGVARRY